MNLPRQYRWPALLLTLLSGCDAQGSTVVVPAKLSQLKGPEALNSNAPSLSAAQRAAISRVTTSPGDLPQLTVNDNGRRAPLPLEHTDVKATLSGNVAQVQVTQRYRNPLPNPLEAVYTFPLPENAAVDAMKIIIGDRVIEGEIKRRDEARRTFNEARAQGHTAALLEQERPNVFTQSVTNIPPASSIEVVIQYAQNLTYDAGEYEFVFPMVVGPRFIPGRAKHTQSGTGYSQDTTLVPDASRISPPVLGHGQRTGHDISLSVTADAGVTISSWVVPTHDVVPGQAAAGKLAITLAKEDRIANRDFVLRYRVDTDRPQVAMLSHKDINDRDGFFSLMIQPPQADVEALVGRKEMIFVIDVSGSMSGVPLAMCKDAMRQTLKMLRPVDTFNVLTFAGRTGKLFSAPQPANDSQLKSAIEFVDGLKAGGGTMMGLGVQEALSPNVEPGRHRYVFFMTDGYIGNEAQIFAGAHRLMTEIEERGQRAKVFSFGTGSSVNRHLLEGIAKAGGGLALYSSTREDPTVAVDKYFSIIDHPVLTNITLDWEGVEVDEVFPKRVPDLFVSRPTIIHGRFRDAKDGALTVRGLWNGKPVELRTAVALHDDHNAHSVLKPLWARSKIAELNRDLVYSGHSANTVEDITQLGLKFGLVTAYTSFVAVDRSATVNGPLTHVTQPVEAPEGVDPAMAGAERKKMKSHTYRQPRQTRGRGRGLRSPFGTADSAAPMPTAEPMRTRSESKPKPYTPVSQQAQGARDQDDIKGRVSQSRDKEAEEERTSQTLRVSGSYDRALIKAAIAKLLSSQSRCTRGLSGSLKVRWFITATGAVIQVRRLGGSISDADARCLLDPLSKLKLPGAAQGAVEVRYTFRF